MTKFLATALLLCTTSLVVQSAYASVPKKHHAIKHNVAKIAVKKPILKKLVVHNAQAKKNCGDKAHCQKNRHGQTCC